MIKNIYLYLLLLLSNNKNKKEVTYMRNYTYNKIVHYIVLYSVVCYTNILYLKITDSNILKHIIYILFKILKWYIYYFTIY